MSRARLRLEGLVHTFPGADRPALDGVDLDVAPGTILVLLGTSGAGKTTLLRVVAGLEGADAGRVCLGDRVLSDPRVRVRPERRGIGLVFQHLELWSHMTVAENIAFGLPGRPRGSAARRNEIVGDLAARVGVDALLARSPATLSGGERQRVAIARTLAPSPEVVLYDEPLANLDPERRRDLRRLIRRLCREHAATLVYVTHDAEEAMEMGDEVAVLHRGRIVDRGTPATLYRAATTLAGARALGPLNALAAEVRDGALETVLGRVDFTGARPDGDVLALLRPEMVRPDGQVEAVVVESRPRGARWSFVAVVGEIPIEGIAERELKPGESVGLAVHGTAVLVPADERVEVVS